MSSSFDLQRMLRRLKPQRHRTMLRRRDRSELPFLQAPQPNSGLLLDTTVYLDELQARLPTQIESALRGAHIWHSTVAECELMALAGLLDPAHPDSANAVAEMLTAIEKRAVNRIVNPDRAVWAEAGVLAGLMARTQTYGKADQRRVLNDALIFLSAAKFGLTVLTRNITDYDLLMQLAPHGKAIFYEL